MTERIDAHHHLWCYTREEYDWIKGDLAPLQRDFLLADLVPLLHSAGVSRTVAVQARQTVNETDWLLSLADGNSPITGVVGWLPVAAPDFPALLDQYRLRHGLKGLRHAVQAEPAGFMDHEAFNTGIGMLAETGLVYDILIMAHQLPEAIRFVDRHPRQAFVLDHIAKPPIRSGRMEPWATLIRELAQRENVTCKVSGLVTEADPAHWSNSQLRAYFEVVLEAFQPARLMIGTDWPVLTVCCAYQQWWNLVEEWIAPLTGSEQAAILGGTAARVYHLDHAVAEAGSR